MFLKKLSIVNYRNIAEAQLSLSPKLNCFIGNNGMGKTNVLDAVFYLSFCKSAMGSLDAQVVRHEQPFFVLEGEYETDDHDGAESIYCGMKRGTKKHFKRNKKEYKRLSEHLGLIPLVLVSPSDVFLIEGGGEERRRLMDMVISQYDYDYIESLSRYNKALQQRNVMLRQEEEPDVEVLKIFEEQMAEEGERIYEKRHGVCQPTFSRFSAILRSDFKEKRDGGTELCLSLSARTAVGGHSARQGERPCRGLFAAWSTPRRP